MEQVKVFISYAHKDDAWREKLRKQLSSLENQGYISAWYDGMIGPGCDWDDEIKKQMEKAEIILLLVSYYFLESEYCIKEEIENALKLHDSGKAKVIPVILTPCDWKNRSFGKLQALPQDGLEISNWKDENEAFKDIYSKLFSAIMDLESGPEPPVAGSVPSINDYLKFEKTPILSVGVDVGATKIACGLVEINIDKEPLYEIKKMVRKDHDLLSANEMQTEIENIIDDVIQKEGGQKEKIDAIGLGLPGMVQREDGYLHFSSGLQITNHDFCGPLHNIYKVPVHADNDVNCSTFAELVAGYGKSFNDFVCVFVGTGIGAGVVVDNRIVRGHNFSAGEIGHMKIDFLPDARKCTCGQKGCYEEYAGARAIIRLARVKIYDLKEREKENELAQKEAEDITPKDIAVLVESGNKAALELATEIAGYLSIGLANIANILNPKAIILGGGVIDGFFGFPDFERMMQTRFNDYAPPACAKTSLLKSSFKSTEAGSPAPIVGAALLPFERDFVK